MEGKNNICYIFDKRFISQGMTAIKSLIVNNLDFDMDIYALLIEMDEEMKKRVAGLGTEKIRVIVMDVSDRISEFEGIDSKGWSYATYIRLLLEEMLPPSVEKILYIDSDTIVTGSIKKIFKLPMGNLLGAAVLDKYIGQNEKKKVGLAKTEPYFNSGVLYVNLFQWRKEALGRKCVDYLKKNDEMNDMPDQNALNVMMRGRYRLLPPAYNVDGYNLMLPYALGKKLMRQPIGDYYSKNPARLYEQARRSPRIVHFVGWYLDKPWLRSNHQPYADEYEKYAGLAGVDVPCKEGKSYGTGLAGMIRERTRTMIGRCISKGDQKGIVFYYLASEKILYAGSCVKRACRFLQALFSHLG